MKCCSMRHFIWVFTVCQSTHLGVSGLQRVNNTDENKYEILSYRDTAGKDSLTLSMLDNFSCCWGQVLTFFKIHVIIFKKIFQEHSNIRVSNDLDPDPRSWSGSKLFPKISSGWQNSQLAGKESIQHRHDYSEPSPYQQMSFKGELAPSSFSICLKCPICNVLNFRTVIVCHKSLDKQGRPRSDYFKKKEAAWAGYSLFAFLACILWVPVLILKLITNILFENRKRKEFKVLEHLPYLMNSLLRPSG